MHRKCSLRIVARGLSTLQTRVRGHNVPTLPITASLRKRHLQTSSSRNAVRPFLLADIGEGITECQIVSWSVKPGDEVQEFDTICEVQSDKASVEITSRFSGVIQTLHYNVDDMAIVGKPLLDINVEDDIEEKTESAPLDSNEAAEKKENVTDIVESKDNTIQSAPSPSADVKDITQEVSPSSQSVALPMSPSVRRLIKQYKLDPAMVNGTGKGGRIRNEDVQNHISTAPSARDDRAIEPRMSDSQSSVSIGEDQVAVFTPIERSMFKAMTNSASIPHFLFTHRVDITTLWNSIAKAKHTQRTNQSENTSHSNPPPSTLLPFVLKALSQAFLQYPKLNSHLLNTTFNTDSPQLLLKAAHNFGIAVDTSYGLLVPVIRNVQSHSVTSLQVEINRLSTLARAGKLNPEDFQSATFTVSNIGSIGGDVVSPIIVAPMVGILGIGRASDSYGVEKDADPTKAERVVRRKFVTLSWSADHRIIDGATVAKAASLLEGYLTDTQSLCAVLR